MQVVSHFWVRVLTSCQRSGVADQESQENESLLSMEEEQKQYKYIEMQKRSLILENCLCKAVAETENVLPQKQRISTARSQSEPTSSQPTTPSSLSHFMVLDFLILMFPWKKQNIEEKAWELFHAIFMHVKFLLKTKRCVRKARVIVSCLPSHEVEWCLSKMQTQNEASPFQTVALSIAAIWFVRSKPVWGQGGYRSWAS